MSDSPNNFPPAKKQKLTTNDGAIGVDGDAHEVILSTGNGFPTESEHCVKQPVISTESTVELISTVAEHENTTQNSTLTCKEKQNDGLQLRTDDIQDQSNKIHLGTNVSELDVGITEFLCNHPGISAIIKQRYSDFIVHEVSLTGETIHLTSTELPSEEPEDKVTNDETVSVLDREVQEQLTELATSEDKTRSVEIPAGEDKQMRQNIHKAVKTAFPMFETQTDVRDGQKVIVVNYKKSGGKDSRQSSCPEWPANKSKLPYCRFVLYKENKDTMDVISLMAKFLKVKEGLFQYAGTKDRRAKTSQEITAYKIHPKKLSGLNNVLRNIKLGNFRYVDKPLKLGELKGNHFTIVLRNTVGSDEDLQRGLNSLKSKGFINYFGMQRFGTTSVPTYEIGRALLKGEWADAIDLILCPRTSNGSSERFRHVWSQTKDPLQTLEATDSRCSIERSLLRALQKSPKNFQGAIQALPRNTRMMYVHSYQSLVWNTMVSKRIQTYGLQPVEGDIVLPSHSGQDLRDEEPKKVQPVVLNESNLSLYSIYDIVLPLPGHDIVYPANEVKTWYEMYLSKDGFDINNLQRKNKDYSLPGAYRTMVVRPADLEWRTFLYDDYTIPLALSDLDRLENISEPKSCPGGKLCAVRLSFTLPSSCYATMALREVLKTDTSPSHQITLNVT
ncbi:hypothetical protein C0Q70_15705 [Pomacea canaliculata]|uniref:TRUD domain-containing protein n=1 Tax=Pomacea canaliculata TaxID=400727 RepID=A0A2T7NVL6_POMCA|nr:hypothetical protein C0Q70_15705 [Pomacea canaliculata]